MEVRNLWKRIIMMVGMALFGSYLTVVPIRSWIDSSRCKKKVKGRYIKTMEERARWNKYYSMKFQYQYDNRNYTSWTMDILSTKQVNKFREGEEYEIYVNPRNPKHIRVLSHYIEFGMVVAFLVGIIAIISAIDGVLKLL